MEFNFRTCIKSPTQPNILNLFGYTGVASLHALEKDAKVTHVDASRPAITWFKENQKLSGLEDKPARIIIDDAIKFTGREIKEELNMTELLWIHLSMDTAQMEKMVI